MSAAHTAGPWTLHGARDASKVIRCAQGHEVCTLPDWTMTANARLIAAAPELLGAVSAAENWIKEYHTHMGYAADSGVEGLLEQLRAVLRQAGGV